MIEGHFFLRNVARHGHRFRIVVEAEFNVEWEVKRGGLLCLFDRDLGELVVAEPLVGHCDFGMPRALGPVVEELLEGSAADFLDRLQHFLD